jgi:hypothetical protein
MDHRPFSTNPSRRVLRQFAAAWLVFFLFLSANEFWRRGNTSAALALAVVSLAGVIGLIKPGTLRLLFVVASAIAFPIGWLISQIMLAVIFYGVVTPVGFVQRVRGRDVLQLKSKPEKSTFWVTRGSQPPLERYFKQF